MKLLSELFDGATTRRLSFGFLTAAGALLFAAFNLIGSGVSGGNKEYAAAVSRCVWPLSMCLLFVLFSIICTEIAEHPSTPEQGHPHSRANLLQTAGTLLVVPALLFLLWGAFSLVTAAQVPAQ